MARQSRGTDRKDPTGTEGELRRLNWALSAYARSSKALLDSTELADVYRNVCEAIVERNDYAIAAIGLASSDGTGKIRIACSAGVSAHYFDGLDINAQEDKPGGNGPSGQAIRSRSTVFLRNIQTDAIFAPWRERARQFNFRSCTAVPIPNATEEPGLLLVYAYEEDAFGNSEIELFEALANKLADAQRLCDERAKRLLAEAAKEAAERRERLITERHNATLRGVSDMIYGLDPEGHITFHNSAAREWVPDIPELIGACLWDILPPVPDRPFFNAFSTAISTRVTQMCEYFDVATSRWIHSIVIPTEDGVTCISRDITEQRHLEEQVHHSQKLEVIGTLAGGVAHDFNNLLTVILGNTELLQDLLQDSPEESMLLSYIDASAKKAAALTNRLLSFSRRQKLSPEILDFADLSTLCETIIGRLIGEQVDIESTVPEGIWPIRVDKHQFETAIVNLCINSRDAMPEGGTISISVTNFRSTEPPTINYEQTLPSGSYVKVVVTDNGQGMTEETRLRALDPFFTTKAVDKGTGLGLSMVYGFVRQSGGSLQIESEPGVGTTISMFFPKYERGPTAQSSPPLHDPLRGGVERILLVEDDADVQRFTHNLLEMLGYRVLTASTVDEALVILSNNEVDVALCDMVLPGGKNGLQLARYIRADFPRVKIALMSGYPDDALDQMDQTTQDLDILAKPFSRTEIAQFIRRTLDENPGE